MYQQIYNNYILKQEEIVQRAKQIIEADKNIKTTYIKQQDKIPDEITKLKIKRQRQQVMHRYNKKFNER